MEIRPAEPADLDRILRLQGQGFNVSAAQLERARRELKLEHFRVAVDRGEIRAVLRVFPFGHVYGGRAIPAAGVASVAVAPEARGRGLGRRLMDATLSELRERSIPLSSLYPATVPLYRACGYGFGMIRASWTARLDAFADVVGGGDVEPYEDGMFEEVAALYGRIAATQNGLVDRDPEWWATRVFSAPYDDAVRYTYVVREAGEATGWICYQTSPSRDSWRFTMSCRDLFWTTETAARTLLGLAALHRSTGETIEWVAPPEEPLQWVLRDRGIERRHSFPAMVRLVDVPAAIEARGYPLGLETAVTITVRDPVFRANEGPWRIEVSGGAAKVLPADDADAECDVQTLASLWASLLTPGDAVRTGGLRGSAHALDALQLLFAGPTPWIADFY